MELAIKNPIALTTQNFLKPKLKPKVKSLRVFSVKCKASLSSVDGAATGVLERPWKTSDARLVLEDGSVWRAKSFGARGTQVGEVVFNTSLTGYQEILTDPSYAGQFVLMTNPHIGNTGVNFDDEESRQCFLAGLVIRSLSISTSNWRCTKALGDYLLERNIMGIYDVDTRAITCRLRQDGSLVGVLTTEESKTDEELLEMSRSWDIVGIDLISGVTCTAPYEWVDKTDPEWDFNCEGRGEIYRVIAYDFGIKHNILRRLSSYGCKITVVPSSWPASETLKMKPDGVLFSNGPGDPSAVPYAVKTVKELLGKVPVFGICMGHQLLGQALGGKTFKMKFGHHGGNHPVHNLVANRVEISAQNHNYAVDPASLPEGVEVTHINLNDGSCAGLAFPVLNVMSLQYHPEASPGPHDSDSVFGEFIELMKKVKQKA
ncbi:PREDICTED: carbamoyl-phosphate synthase small chain, chloroplastic-like [Populus euphratica]|uniref:Carbamoyl phosphate synthase small chain, chloroplastic n=1 Tax=Populus euphratica TaxID=75702 RepID=A0AAJ6VGQ7_POPEU|nr:PREDICTED: carbamoyl-phosphate synthase small chain, chloroplastic-like [Populus euphratica]XP_011047591.1 PREDICTED: carbamoyl-phosphate synthase small chain, chloroplastic-like [Populus euphratica]